MGAAKIVVGVAFALLATHAHRTGRSFDYPNRPIRIIVRSPPAQASTPRRA